MHKKVIYFNKLQEFAKQARTELAQNAAERDSVNKSSPFESPDRKTAGPLWGE